MVIVQENEVKRAANVAKMSAQLQVWMTAIDQHERHHRHDLGSPPETVHEKEEHALQIARVRTRHKSVSIRFDEFRVAPMESAPWGNFRAGIADEWTTLETGVRNLDHGARRAGRASSPIPSAGTEVPAATAMPSETTGKAVKSRG